MSLQNEENSGLAAPPKIPIQSLNSRSKRTWCRTPEICGLREYTWWVPQIAKHRCCKSLQCLRRHIQDLLSDSGAEYSFTRAHLLWRWFNQRIEPFASLPREMINHIISYDIDIPKDVDLAARRLKTFRKKFPFARIDLDGFGERRLMYSLPVLVEYLPVLSYQCQQRLFNFIYFVTNLHELALPLDPTEFYSSICDLLKKKQVCDYTGDPPEANLLNYALANPCAIDILKTMVETQPHAERWIAFNHEAAIQLTRYNEAATVIVNDVAQRTQTQF